MVWSGVMPDQSRKLASQRGELGGREQAHELDPGDVGAGRHGRGLAHRCARGLDSGAVEVDQVHRHLRPPARRERETQGAHAGQPAVALAHPASRSRARAPMSSRSSSQLIATSTGRAPTAIAPSRGCGVVGTDVGCSACGTRADAPTASVRCALGSASS